MNISDIKKLQQKKYRELFQHYLLEGEHLVLELLKAAQTQTYLRASQLLISEHYQTWIQQHNTLGLKVIVLDDKQMRQVAETKTPQGIVAVVPFTSVSQQTNQTKKAIYLHEIQDPGNLGTILRTLAWFGGFQCFLSSNSVDIYNPKVLRSSMGGIFYVDCVLNADLKDVQQRYPRMAYLDMHGTSIKDPLFKQFDCYVFGNEARGVPLELLKQVEAQAFTIEGAGQVESLNLAQALAMSVFSLV